MVYQTKLSFETKQINRVPSLNARIVIFGKHYTEVGLKLNIQKTKIMASGPTTSWEIDGETVERVSDFIFLGSKITTDGDCSHQIKRCLLTPWKESYDQPR